MLHIIFLSLLSQNRAVSSAGLEHCLDKAGVSGSSPLQRTKSSLLQIKKTPQDKKFHGVFFV